MADLEFDFDGLDETQRRLAKVATALLDLRPFWPLVVPLFVSWMREQFETEGAFGGDPWQPLSPAYAAAKAIRYPGKGILVAEGDLRQAASRPKRDAGPRELVLTIDDPKAGYHQEGTARMPARPLLFERLPMSAEREVEAAARKYVEELLDRI